MVSSLQSIRFFIMGVVFLHHYFIKKVTFLFWAVLISVSGLKGQISIDAYQTPYYQNFNTLSSSGTSSNVPLGWSFYETGGSPTTYEVSDGNKTSGNTYSFGANGSVERAFGSIRTGTVNTTIGERFVNNTGGVITRFIIEYTGEQWRIGNATSNDRMDFQYSTTATYLHGTIGWVDFNALDFVSPVAASASATALDGNDPANRTTLSAEITGLNIPNGASFWVRWLDFNADYSDDGLAIDDFSFTASDACPLSINSLTPASGPVNTVVHICGSNLDEVTAVFFNGMPALFSTISNDTIRTIVPNGAATGRVRCLAGCAVISANDFVVTRNNCPSTQGLIISELCDPETGFETDRFIEIYNPTGTPIDLTGWSVRAIPNNEVDAPCSEWVMCWNLSGTINAYQALTCGYSGAQSVTHDFTSPEWFTNSGVNGACYYWNGQWRDGAALYNGETRVDGIVRDQTADDWYSNRSLVRKPGICSPQPNSSYLEWEPTATVSTAGTLPATPHVHICDGAIAEMPVISGQPLSQETCGGSMAVFTVELINAMEPLQYQWFILVNDTWEQVTNGAHYSGANTGTLTILNVTSAMDGDQFYCIIAGSDSDCYAVTNAAQLSVNDLQGPLTTTIWHQ